MIFEKTILLLQKTIDMKRYSLQRHRPENWYLPTAKLVSTNLRTGTYQLANWYLPISRSVSTSFQTGLVPDGRAIGHATNVIYFLHCGK